MIIKKVRLFPFAGINDKELLFEKKLNIIHGPNEVGKSTIVKALFFVLFTPVKLTPSKEKALLENTLPANGGDTIRVKIEFESAGVNYILYKTWGGQKQVSLKIDGVLELNEFEKVQQKMEEVLGLNEATWKNVLFSKQALLEKTITLIRDQSEITNSFSDILRSAVMVQGGISPEKLKEELQQNIEKYYGYWDRVNNAPIGNRGISNRWTRNVGKILTTYYQLEEAKNNFDLSLKYQTELDHLVKEIGDQTADYKKVNEFVQKNQDIAKDVRIRAKLTGDLALEKHKLDKFKDANINWPKLLANKELNQTLLTSCNENIIKLNTELGIATQKENAKQKSERYATLLILTKELNLLEQQLKDYILVEPTDLKEARLLYKAIEQNRLKIEAQKLKISILVKENFTAKITQGLGLGEQKEFFAGNDFQTEVPGKFEMETSQYVFKVFSGNEDIQLLSNQIQIDEKTLNEILARYQVVDLSQLEKLEHDQKEIKSKIEVKNGQIKTMLGNDKLSDLAHEMQQLESLPSVRETIYLRGQIQEESNKITAITLNQGNDSKITDHYVKEFLSPENLNDLLIDSLNGYRNVEKEILALKPLPEGITSADDFLKQYDNFKESLMGLFQKNQDLINKKTLLEKDEPAYTLEELKQQIEVLNKELERNKSEGLAYSKILTRLDELLAFQSEEVFGPYYELTKKYFSEITGGRYSDISMDNILPSSVSNGSFSLPADLLSQGTKDALALALKLSMSSYYLKNSDGFIVMDDPLTDMDQNRQVLAANSLRNFSNDKQVILFTCHQSHAEILNGHHIVLS